MNDKIKTVLNMSRIERAAIVRNHASEFNRCLKRVQDLAVLLHINEGLSEKEREEMDKCADEAIIHELRFGEIVKQGAKSI